MEDDEYTLDLTSIDVSTNTITITSNNSAYVSVGDITYDTGTGTLSVFSDSHDWISISDVNTIDLSNITFDRVVFEDDMPDPQELKEMCEEYPALEKAYENFKTIYKMVHQDWRGKQDAEK